MSEREPTTTLKMLVAYDKVYEIECPVSTTAKNLLEAVTQRFGLDPDSWELILQTDSGNVCFAGDKHLSDHLHDTQEAYFVLAPKFQYG